MHICLNKNWHWRKVLRWKLIADTETKMILRRQDDKVGIDYDANVGVLRVSKWKPT